MVRLKIECVIRAVFDFFDLSTLGNGRKWLDIIKEGFYKHYKFESFPKSNPSLFPYSNYFLFVVCQVYSSSSKSFCQKSQPAKVMLARVASYDGETFSVLGRIITVHSM